MQTNYETLSKIFNNIIYKGLRGTPFYLPPELYNIYT